MTKLQIKALQEADNLLRSVVISFPVQRGETKEEFETNWNYALGSIYKERNKISKGLEWLQAALEDGKNKK